MPAVTLYFTPYGLTPREWEVLQRTCEAKVDKAICREMGIELRTLQTHKKHINEKMGTHSTLAMVVKAFREGLLWDLPPKGEEQAGKKVSYV